MTSPLRCNSAHAPTHVAVLKILQLWLNVVSRCIEEGDNDIDVYPMDKVDIYKCKRIKWVVGWMYVRGPHG